ncbi:thioredoxin family protein [Thiothrix subterranea]|uniref:Thioredoxin family protein n=1 Tax=Thiothrix subterranea TaxID=2735563 RepID=A0AA51MI15_9GAMM|nr:thioredoxin family protein [Thiothrix subterranea]MDQ5768723.1 thioredoxin family protein [Thiothrix subterranea]WML84874.1 thioredoxin family protein [Thiothrix subterranea]
MLSIHAKQRLSQGLLLMLATFAFAGNAFAAEVPFDRTQFVAAQATGKPILVRFHATWCSTCRAQEPVIAELLAAPENKDVTAFLVDFDAQKDVVKNFEVPMQSTLVVVKGENEVSRTIGETRKDALAAEIAKARL